MAKTNQTMTIDVKANVSVTSHQWPCDRGFGDGVGRGYHNFYGGYYGSVTLCTFCGKRAPMEPLKVTCGDTKASGGTTYPYQGPYATGGYVRSPTPATWVRESSGYIVPKSEVRFYAKDSFQDPNSPTVAELNESTPLKGIASWWEQ